LSDDDWRRGSPRFQGQNLQRNLELVKRIQEVAQDRECSPAQLAIAWVLAKGENIVPIVGTKRRNYLEENIGALNVKLTSEEVRRLDEAVPRGAAVGDRYPEATLKFLNR
jgi:aryl-alcohol dehydrogenase-like predicted oxidoreductase